MNKEDIILILKVLIFVGLIVLAIRFFIELLPYIIIVLVIMLIYDSYKKYRQKRRDKRVEIREAEILEEKSNK